MLCKVLPPFSTNHHGTKRNREASYSSLGNNTTTADVSPRTGCSQSPPLIPEQGLSNWLQDGAQSRKSLNQGV